MQMAAPLEDDFERLRGKRTSMKKRKGTLLEEFFQKRSKWMERRVQGQRERDFRASEGVKEGMAMEEVVVEEVNEEMGGLLEAREEKEVEGEEGFHILLQTPSGKEEEEKKTRDLMEEKEETSDLMVNEDQEIGTSSFNFLPLSAKEEEEEKEEGSLVLGKEEEEGAYKDGKSFLMASPDVKASSNRFHFLSSALSEELKYELYLVQNL